MKERDKNTRSERDFSILPQAVQDLLANLINARLLALHLQEQDDEVAEALSTQPPTCNLE